MKILAYIIGGLLLVVLIALGFIFSPWGNSMIASYAQDIAKQKTGADIKFENFKLGFSSADITAKINDEISANIKGDLSVFTQSLNLSYQISASSLKSANLTISEPINLNGQISGKFSDFNANGAGKALGSNINFLARIKEYKPLLLTLNAKTLKIADALALIGKPAYVNGLLDVTADIKEQDGKRAGTAEILLYDALANNAVVARDFNLTLPVNFTLKGAINAQIDGENIDAKSLFITPIATAKTTQTRYDIAKNTLASDFAIDAPDLAKFEPIIKQSLTGSLKAGGNMLLTGNKLSALNATIDGLGGQINANLNSDKLEAKISNIKLANILNLLAKPAYASADISGDVVLENLADIKNIKGSAKLATGQGKLNAAQLKGLNLNLSKDVAFSLNSDVSVANSLAKFDMKLISELLNLEGVKGEFDIAKNTLVSKFSLVASDLTKFESLLGQKLSGALKINGEAKMANGKILELEASGNALGGDLAAQIKGENLKFSIKNGALKDAFLLAAIDPLANGALNLNANFSPIDFKNLNGNVKLSLENGEIYEKEASKMTGKNFPADVKFNANADVKFEKNVANFTAKIASDLLNLQDTNGKFDLNSGVLDAKFQANIPELSRLKFATQRELKGALDISGNAIKSADNLEINANSKIFDGAAVAKFKNGLLNATIKDFTFKSLSHTANFNHIYDGVGNAEFNYNTALQNGDFDIDIKEGRLVANGLTNTIKTFTGRDITTEIYKDGFVRGTIEKNLIKFNSQMSAQRSDINATAAVFDTASGAMNIPLEVRYEKTDAKIAITGTKDAPKYSISSNYLKQKASDKIDKFIDRKLKSEDNATKDVVKGLLKGLF